MTIPWRTPTSATPSAQARASSELGPPHAVEPPQLGDVEQADRGGDDDRREDRLRHRLDEARARATSISSTSAAATRPVSWVFAPDWAATAVREPLVLTGNPENRPAARLATPIPASSWLPSTS